MIHSPTHDTIFIHVPKAAGTSVKNLLRQCGYRLLQEPDQREEYRAHAYKQGTGARMKRLIEPDVWQRSFKFAVCRNPYDRLVSGWNFCREKEQLDVPFDYFVRNLGTYRAPWIDLHCIITQLQHLLVDGVPVVDHVCRFENLDADFEPIRQRLGRPDLRLPRLNAFGHRPYQEYFTKELQDMTFARFAVDFEYFGYGYDL